LDALSFSGRRFELKFSCKNFDWSCETYLKTGKNDARRRARAASSLRRDFSRGCRPIPASPITFPFGDFLIPIRRSFQQYVNLRPVRLLKGIQSPLRKCRAGQIDFCVVRENNEGEYSDVGGRIFRDSEEEMAMQRPSSRGAEWTESCDMLFELSRKRKSHVTSATKSNGIIHTMPFWD